MNLNEAIQFANTALEPVMGKDEAASCAKILLEKISGLHRSSFFLHYSESLSAQQEEALKAMLEAMEDGRPVQYVLNETWFCDMPFYVNDHVLIPRPETEELVDLIAKENTGSELKVLDIGTGSGCIPIALAKLKPTWKIFAIDVSTDALDVAQNNAMAHQVDVNFQCVDVLNNNQVNDFFKKVGAFDIIVSNPPYISFNERESMGFSVLNFEPHLALFANSADDLIFYRAINALAKNHLVNEGKLYYEISEFKGKEMKELMQSDGFNKVKLISDISGKNRIISAVK